MCCRWRLHSNSTFTRLTRRSAEERNLMYNSVADSISGGRTRKKREVSQLAKDSFEAFEPFINVFDCGVKWLDSPVHLITKQDWQFHAQHKAGETPTYPDGSKFNPYLDIVRNIYSPAHIDRHYEDGELSYYTSGRKGQGLLYLDVDSHKTWQTDDETGRADLEQAFPFGYFRPSFRGQNGYLKVSYSSIAEFNDFARRLQTTLRRTFLHLGILADIEVKGTITHKDKSGLLAKLPFTDRCPCNMRDETDTWNYPLLEKFKACPVVNVRRIKSIAGQLEFLIDEDRVSRGQQHKKCLGADQKTEATDSQASTPSVESPKPTISTPHEIVKPTVLPTVVKSTTKSGEANGDAFARNQKDLLPFTRQFFKRHQRFPDVEDALTHLQDNGLFSGQWEDNQSHRARRVGDILNHISRTFDSENLGSGESQPLALSSDKFSWWVRQHIGKGLSGTVSDLRSFDPVTMSVQVKKVTVPAEFIETFLVVADVCLNQDPLGNKAVPTSRFKKLWSMVKGGEAWNQTYFQIVRDKLDRMGVIQIVDREQKTGKAWRWEAGGLFPAASWREEQQQLKEKAKALRSGTEDSLPDVSGTRREKEHNTLYETNNRILELQAGQQAVRPPP